MFTYPQCPECSSEAERSDVPYGHASMLLFGEGSEATEPYNKYNKIRPHSFRSLQFEQKVRPLPFRPENFDLFTAIHIRGTFYALQHSYNLLIVILTPRYPAVTEFTFPSLEIIFSPAFCLSIFLTIVVILFICK